MAIQESTGRTLKAWRILVRSNLQAATVFSSLFARRSRDIVLRFPRLTIFAWISATVLRSKAW